MSAPTPVPLADRSRPMIVEYDAEMRMTKPPAGSFALTGMTPQQLMDVGCEARVHPDDIAALRDGLAQAVRNGSDHFSIVYRLAHVDGSWGWVESIFSIRRGADSAMLSLQSATRDIGSRLLLEHERDGASLRVPDIDETTVGMGVIDAEGRWVRLNPAMCRLLGGPQDEFIGRSSREMTHPDDRAESERQYQQLLDGQADTVVQNKRWIRPDGSAAAVHRTAWLLRDDAGDPASIILQAVDLSRQRSEWDTRSARATAENRVGLVNTVLFTERVDAALATARRRGRRVGILLVDVDMFAAINASFGRAAGDQVLRDVAARLNSAIGVGDSVARLSADEFAVLCEDISDAGDLEAIGIRIGCAFTPVFTVCGREVNLTVSVGLAIDDDTGDADRLIRTAGRALTTAKRNGGNRIQTTQGALDLSVDDGQITVAELRDALVKNQLRMFYQPVVALDTGTVVGHEALLRWCHPTRGPLSPDSFLPVLEETVLVHEVGAWVLRTACQEAADHDDGLDVAVNVSPSQLVHPDFVDLVADTLTATGLDPHRLVLEITESSILQASTQSLNCSAALTELGITLALDDFGTGNSSLASLQRMPIGVLKIDRSFTAQIGSSRATERLIIGMIRLAEATQLQTVAEGIENEEQAHFLRNFGCVFGQGYLYGRPRPLP